MKEEAMVFSLRGPERRSKLETAAAELGQKWYQVPLTSFLFKRYLVPFLPSDSPRRKPRFEFLTRGQGRSKTIASSQGFTLIELIMVIAILSVIGVFGSQMFLETTEIFLESRNRRDVVQEARYAIERMSREIREDIDTTGDITIFTSSTFTYTDPSSTSISFTKSSSNLLRNSDVLAGNVSALTFTYLKADGTTASAAADIWRIQISLTVALEDATITLRSQVFPRNLYNDNANFASWTEQ